MEMGSMLVWVTVSGILTVVSDTGTVLLVLISKSGFCVPSFSRFGRLLIRGERVLRVSVLLMVSLCTLAWGLVVGQWMA